MGLTGIYCYINGFVQTSSDMVNIVSVNDTIVVQSWCPKNPFWGTKEPKFQIFKNYRIQMAVSGIYCYINGLVQTLVTW